MRLLLALLLLTPRAALADCELQASAAQQVFLVGSDGARLGLVRGPAPLRVSIAGGPLATVKLEVGHLKLEAKAKIEQLPFSLTDRVGLGPHLVMQPGAQVSVHEADGKLEIAPDFTGFVEDAAGQGVFRGSVSCGQLGLDPGLLDLPISPKDKKVTGFKPGRMELLPRPGARADATLVVRPGETGWILSREKAWTRILIYRADYTVEGWVANKALKPARHPVVQILPQGEVEPEAQLGTPPSRTCKKDLALYQLGTGVRLGTVTAGGQVWPGKASGKQTQVTPADVPGLAMGLAASTAELDKACPP